MFVSSAVFAAGIILGLIFSVRSPYFFESIFLLASVFVFSIILTLFSTIYSAVLHLAVILVKGKGKFYQTFKVICYSTAPINFAGLFIFVALMAASHQSIFIIILMAILLGLFICALYMFYITVVGISVTSEISGNRAFAALMIQFFIFALIPVTLTYAPAFFYQGGTDTHSRYVPTPPIIPAYEKYTQNSEKYKITAYAGSPPQIDGAVTDEDKWYEGEKISIESRRKYYAITTKHDFEYIYILMEWSGDPAENKNIAIYFEQDGSKPDFNLSNGRVDSFYQRSYSAISAANINDKWTLEWKIPMYSENKYDINIDRYPTELGFSIIDAAALESGGIFPPDANNHKPRTWGTMTIVDKRRQ